MPAAVTEYLMASIHRLAPIAFKSCIVIACILLAVAILLVKNFSSIVKSEESSISLYAKLEELEPKFLPGRFVMALNYYEKTTMATRNLLSLSQFTTDWNARIVLPFFHGSHFRGIPDQNSTYFGDIVNLSQLQQIYKELELTPFVEFDFFIANASRTMYYVTVEYRVGMTGPIRPVNCSEQLYKRVIIPLNEQAKKQNAPLFSTALTTCCYMVCSTPVVPEEIAEVCGFRDKRDISIVFNQWNGHRTTPKMLREVSYKIYAPEYKKSVTTGLPLADGLIDDAKALVNGVTGGSNVDFLGVHIRAERLLKQERLDGVDPVGCLKEAIDLANSTANSQNIKIVYFGDYHVPHFKDLLEEREVEIVRFDPTEYGHTGYMDEAYVAQVEQTAIAQAKQLVLVGGGTFQFRIIDKCECPYVKICGPAHQ